MAFEPRVFILELGLIFLILSSGEQFTRRAVYEKKTNFTRFNILTLCQIKTPCGRQKIRTSRLPFQYNFNYNQRLQEIAAHRNCAELAHLALTRMQTQISLRLWFVL